MIGVPHNREVAAAPKSFDDSDSFDITQDLPLGKSITFRVVLGVIKVNRVWLPNLREDRETQHWRPSWTVVKVNDNNDAFRDLRDEDVRLQMKTMPSDQDRSKVYSKFQPSSRWSYWGFLRDWPDRKEDEEPELKVIRLEAPQAVYNGLMELQHETSKKKGKENLLVHGPIWAYDVVIKCDEKPNMPAGVPEWQKRLYKVKAVINADFVEKFDEKCLKNPVPEDFDFVSIGAFTQEEMDVVNKFSVDMDEEARPHTDQEIVEMFAGAPLDLMREKKNGQPVFSDPAGLAKFINAKTHLKIGDVEVKPGENIDPPHGGTQKQLPKTTEEKPATGPIGEGKVVYEGEKKQQPSKGPITWD